MKAIWLLPASLFLLALPVKAEPRLSLSGSAIQGGMMLGTAPANAQMFLDGEPIPVASDGRFVLGFGRDHKETALLEVRHGGKTTRTVIKIRKRHYETQYIDGLDEDQVRPPPEAWPQIKREAAAKRKARAMLHHALSGFREKFVWPASGQISGVYGSQRVLNGKPRRPHYGIDIAAKPQSIIVAPASGVITLAAPDFYFEGGLIFLDHGLELSSAFLHLGKIFVRVGQKVSQGEKIAAVGKSGRSTGAHLDWRIKWRRQNLDPALVVAPEEACRLGASLYLAKTICYEAKANSPAAGGSSPPNNN